MNVAKVKKNIANLKKVREIIEISKFDTLHKLQTANKVTDTFMKMAVSSKNIIEFATKKYWVKSPLMKVSKSDITIWVFTSISSSMLATSYSQQENIILAGFDREKDSLIVVGNPASKFAHRVGIKPLYEEKDIDEGLNDIPAIIASLTSVKDAPRIKFVSHNSYLPNEAINILPVSEFNIEVEIEPVNKKVKFFPSLTSSISSLGTVYSERLTEALIRDAKYYYLKEKLIRHESSLKSVDKKIDEKFREMNKLIRKLETEELILVSQIAKRGDGYE